MSVYCASKAAVISLTQSSGLDLIKHAINVNGIAPGVVDTPMWEAVDALFARYEKTAPWARKSAWSVKPYPLAAWACRKITPVPQSFWLVPTAITLLLRRSMWMAVTG